jgi:serine/threonine protein kinase
VTQDVRSDPGGLVPGEQLAGYQVQEEIGHGGMAIVYRALDLRLGRVVALKVLAPHLGEDEAFRQRFIRESRAAAGVDHPHIIPVFEAGEAAGVLFIAMRYVGHGDVRSLIDTEGRLAPARAAAIVAQAASALDAAHAHGLVHRDVKPGNMLLTLASDDSDHVYLSDFGLSKQSLNPNTLTSTGQFLGTLDYVSPEQIQGHPVDGRADQYALACTAVEMLSGTPPFRHDDSMAVMWAQIESAPPSVTQRRPELSPAVDEVIAIAMAKSPASRYPTCREFAAALSAACEPPARPRTAPAEIRADWPDLRPARPWPGDKPAADHQPGFDGPGSDGARSDGARSDGARSDEARSDGAGAERSARMVPGTRLDNLPARINPVGYAAHEPAHPLRPPATPAGRTWPHRLEQASWAARGSWHFRRGRTFAVGTLAGLVVLAGAAGIGYKLAHHQQVPPHPHGATSTGPAASGPEADHVVRQYFNDINRHRFRAAYQLSAKSETYAEFRAGFAGTKRDTVTITKTDGNVVTAVLKALQADGSVKTFEGTYTVTNGTITNPDVHLVGETQPTTS